MPVVLEEGWGCSQMWAGGDYNSEVTPWYAGRLVASLMRCKEAKHEALIKMSDWKFAEVTILSESLHTHGPMDPFSLLDGSTL